MSTQEMEHLVNRSELVNAVAEKTDMPRMQVEAVLAATLDQIMAATSTEKVILAGFGTFEARNRAAREGRNPGNRRNPADRSEPRGGVQSRDSIQAAHRRRRITGTVTLDVIRTVENQRCPFGDGERRCSEGGSRRSSRLPLQGVTELRHRPALVGRLCAGGDTAGRGAAVASWLLLRRRFCSYIIASAACCAPGNPATTENGA